MNEYEKWFRAHWKELARTGEDDKEFAIRELGLPPAIKSCYACEYARRYDLSACGGDCVVVWGNRAGCADKNSPYISWLLSGSKSERKKWAKIISELPWVERRLK